MLHHYGVTDESRTHTVQNHNLRHYHYATVTIVWSRGWDSNSRSPAPKAGALSRTKLHRECMVLCEGLEPSSPDYKTGILAFEITEQIWQGHLESNQEWRNQNPWLYRLTIPQLIGSEGGNRTPTNGFGDRRTAIILPRNCWS